MLLAAALLGFVAVLLAAGFPLSVCPAATCPYAGATMRTSAKAVGRSVFIAVDALLITLNNELTGCSFPVIGDEVITAFAVPGNVGIAG
jgi:hypothetical protein